MYTATQIYGARPQPPAAGIAAPTQSIGVGFEVGGFRELLNPSNPLLWFGVILAVTLGAAAVSGSARLGKTQLNASVGKA